MESLIVYDGLTMDELSNKLEKNSKITIPREFNLHNSKLNKNYSTHLINKNKFQKSKSNLNLNVIIIYFILFFLLL